MPVDALAKDDVSKSNAALASLLANGRLVLIDENAEMVRRKEHPGAQDRSHAASRRTSTNVPA
eukprot:4461069-Pyramimonas_sp.AAC.1